MKQKCINCQFCKQDACSKRIYCIKAKGVLIFPLSWKAIWKFNKCDDFMRKEEKQCQ